MKYCALTSLCTRFFSSAPSIPEQNGSAACRPSRRATPSGKGRRQHLVVVDEREAAYGALADDDAGLHGDERAGDDGAPADDDAAMRLRFSSAGGSCGR